MEKLISPLQMAFVLGRKGIDNAIIAGSHSLFRKEKWEGWINDA